MSLCVAYGLVICFIPQTLLHFVEVRKALLKLLLVKLKFHLYRIRPYALVC